jgi:DNA-binding NarL/FixJ family response regulator
VVVFTAALDDDEMVDALRLGARGLVLKEMSPSLLLQCIRTVHTGGQWLERRFSLRAIGVVGRLALMRYAQDNALI